MAAGANFVQEVPEHEWRMKEAQKYLDCAIANLQLRQFRRAKEMLLRAQADIETLDRLMVEARETRGR